MSTPPSSAATSSKAESPKASPSQFGSAADKIRETAKWLATAFGALGAALITSLSLADLRGLSGTQLAFSLLGFGLGIIGTGVVLASLTRVLMTISASVAEISGPDTDPETTRLLQAHPSILGGFSDPEALATQFSKAQRERIDSYTKMLRDSGTGKPVDPATQHIHNRATKMLQLANPIVERVLGFVAFDRLRRRFKAALYGIAIGIVLAVAGVSLFAYYSNAQEEDGPEPPVVAGRPVEAIVDLTPEGETAFGDVLGAGCILDALKVMAVGSSEDSVDVISLSEGSCEVRRLTITPELGVVCPLGTAIEPTLPPDPDDADTGGELVC